jgi:hypothetical protein
VCVRACVCVCVCDPVYVCVRACVRVRAPTHPPIHPLAHNERVCERHKNDSYISLEPTNADTLHETFAATAILPTGSTPVQSLSSRLKTVGYQTCASTQAVAGGGSRA